MERKQAERIVGKVLEDSIATERTEHGDVVTLFMGRIAIVVAKANMQVLQTSDVLPLGMDPLGEDVREWATDTLLDYVT